MAVNDSVGEHAGGEMGHALAEDREGTISIHGGEKDRVVVDWARHGLPRFRLIRVIHIRHSVRYDIKC